MLRNKIASDLALEKSSLLSSLQPFVEYVLEQAVLFEPFHVADLRNPPTEYSKIKKQAQNSTNSPDDNQFKIKQEKESNSSSHPSIKLPPLCLNPIHRTSVFL